MWPPHDSNHQSNIRCASRRYTALRASIVFKALLRRNHYDDKKSKRTPLSRVFSRVSPYALMVLVCGFILRPSLQGRLLTHIVLLLLLVGVSSF